METYTSVKDELELLEVVRNAPYNQIFAQDNWLYAELRDGTYTVALTMEELRNKLNFIAQTEVF